MLDLFRAYGRSGQDNNNVSDLFVDGWNPEPVNGTSNGSWGKKDEFKDGSGGPEICWDYDGAVQPLGLIEMGDDEKEVGYNVVCRETHTDLMLDVYDFCKFTTKASRSKRQQRNPTK